MLTFCVTVIYALLCAARFCDEGTCTCTHTCICDTPHLSAVWQTLACAQMKFGKLGRVTCSRRASPTLLRWQPVASIQCMWARRAALQHTASKCTARRKCLCTITLLRRIYAAQMAQRVGHCSRLRATTRTQHEPWSAMHGTSMRCTRQSGAPPKSACAKRGNADSKDKSVVYVRAAEIDSSKHRRHE